MSQNDNKSKNQLDEKENLDIMLNNNTESYLIMRNKNVKADNQGKEKCLLNYENDQNDESNYQPKKRRRSNSVDLYKKHKRDREKKKTNRENNNKIGNNNNVLVLNERPVNNITKNKITNKELKDGKVKKVTFLNSNFITIIDVESYKKFNMENTCKDPFEDMEFLKNIHNINNFNININNSQNNSNNHDKNEDDGKERVNCTCLIF